MKVKKKELRKDLYEQIKSGVGDRKKEFDAEPASSFMCT